jgi:hypothetical protein
MMARVRASLTSQRQDALLESLANAALWMAAQTAQGDSTTAARRRESAGQLLQLLEQQSRLPGMDATRLEEVRSRLTALQRRP